MTRRTKRLWTDEEKRSICLQTTAPGVSVAQVARRYAMNANMIFKWLWTCSGLVERCQLTLRAFRSKATGLSKPSDECRLTGLQNPPTYLAMALSACLQVCHATGHMSSDLMVLKKVSTMALS